MENLTNEYILGDAFDYLPKIKDKSVDLVFTGIPDLEELSCDNLGEYLSFLAKAMKAISRIVKDEGFVVMCQTDRKFKGTIILKHLKVLKAMKVNGFKVKDYKILVKDSVDKVNLYRLNYSHILVFTKTGKIPTKKRKGDYLKDLWISQMPKNKNFWGEDFTELIIETLTEPNDLVVDPFAGRGTVLKSAKKLGRKYFGTEIKKDVYNPEFVDDQG